MKNYIMAIDQGTTGSRCVIFDRSGTPRASAYNEFPQIFPKPGWVEHDPEDILHSVLSAAEKAFTASGLSAGDIAAIGITNQRETAILWDRRTGKPVCNGIVWQCRRTAPLCEEIRASGYDRVLREKTGLVCDPYFSLTKLKWMLDHIPHARELAEAGELCFGTPDSFLIWQLTGGRSHVTDITNASRTMMFNIHTRKWDEEILRHFDIPASVLPKVLPCDGFFGETSLLGEPIPIHGAAGDQQASLFGQCCFAPGQAKNTYGTGCFLLMNTGEKPIASENGLLTTVAWQIGGKTAYALEGSVFIAGAAVQWLRDGIGIIGSPKETAAMAESIPSAEGVYFVPAFTGLGAPYWDPDARGIITGITRGTTRAHIVRAALESMAYQTADLLAAMGADAGFPVTDLRVDGGASANDFLMGFQADISGIRVSRSAYVETTVKGAALLAGLGCGLYASPDEIAASQPPHIPFSPAMSGEQRSSLLAGWHNAVKRSFSDLT